MKPKFLLTAAFLCIIGLSAFAQKSKSPGQATRLIPINEAFFSLVIEDDIPVELTEGNSNQITVKGDEDIIKKLRVKLSEGKLYLSYFPSNFPPPVKVYVPAALLTKVNIQGRSELTSSSILTNPKLRIVVAGEGKVHLRSIGQVIVEGTDEFDFVKAVR